MVFFPATCPNQRVFIPFSFYYLQSFCLFSILSTFSLGSHRKSSYPPKFFFIFSFFFPELCIYSIIYPAVFSLCASSYLSLTFVIWSARQSFLPLYLFNLAFFSNLVLKGFFNSLKAIPCPTTITISAFTVYLLQSEVNLSFVSYDQMHFAKTLLIWRDIYSVE